MALNNLHWLICPKTKPNQTKPNVFLWKAVKKSKSLVNVSVLLTCIYIYIYVYIYIYMYIVQLNGDSNSVKSS